MNASVIAILEENECEIPDMPPPPNAHETTNPVEGLSDFSSFNTKPLYQAAGDSPETETLIQKYVHARQFYMNKDRAEKRCSLINEHLENFKNILKNGSLEEIGDLYKQRHVWRKKAHEIREDGQPICQIDSCIHVALPGSIYCVNHILNDPNQKLFVMCPECKRPHPINSDCFTCRTK
jgi:hypothetical protein